MEKEKERIDIRALRKKQGNFTQFGANLWKERRRECYVDNHGKGRGPQDNRSDATKRYMG